MYQIVKTDSAEEVHGHRTPVLTLADEYGGRCQIVVDDKCYMLLLKREDGSYFSTDHIFPEAFAALMTLPPPNSRVDAVSMGATVKQPPPCSVCGKPGHRPMDHAGWHPDDDKAG